MSLKSVLLAFCLSVDIVLSAQGVWTRKADFVALLDGSASFSIGTKGYIATGYGISSVNPYRYEMWEWDRATDTWTQKASLPGPGRCYAKGFSIGTKGYVALGIAYGGVPKPELWEWDQASNSWTRKSDFPAPVRTRAVSFSIGTCGYIATGTDEPAGIHFADLWEWDQLTDTWSRKADYGGGAVCVATGFSIGNKGYIGTGTDSTPYTARQDFWEWDQATDTWTRKSDFPGGARGQANSFSISGKGYLGCGSFYTTVYRDLWAWDPALDQWTRMADLPGLYSYWSGAACFELGNCGYFETGSNKMLYEFAPDSLLTDLSENSSRFSISVYPNPCNGIFKLYLSGAAKESYKYEVLGQDRKILYRGNFNSDEPMVNAVLKGRSPGIYFIRVSKENYSQTRSIVVN
ncbi:MAG: T9SS type A sorting domain-containing protein [Bacteroidia bacterium]